jgi:hypothetical protein
MLLVARAIRGFIVHLYYLKSRVYAKQDNEKLPADLPMIAGYSG